MNNIIKSLDKPILSLCMIVKNEKDNLSRCLASAKPYVDEIVIIDTGSNDGTPEIAAEYGAKIKYFQWCDDFAAARNYALSQVSGNWVLVLDADEELVINTDNFLEEINKNQEIIAYLIPLIDNHNQEMTPLYIVRLFRNLPEIKYLGRYHEYLNYHNHVIPSQLIGNIENIKIIHYGYNPEISEEKNINRNIPILERARQEEGLSLMLLYTLAGMYGFAQQEEKSQECFAEAFDKLIPNLLDGNPPEKFGFVPSLIYVLGAQSLEKEDYETARLLSQRGIEWCTNYPPLNYLAGATVMALGFPLGAIPYFEKCLNLGREGNYYKGEPFEKSFITTYPACALGKAYIQLGWMEAAISMFELALSFDANCSIAQQHIDKIQEILSR